MCISNNFIEQQAHVICKEILEKTVYKVKRLEFSGGGSILLEGQDYQWNGRDLITNVILQDETGKLYSVKPDDFGLKFANGEMTYKEYIKSQKKEDSRGVWYIIVTIGFFIIMMLTIMVFK